MLKKVCTNCGEEKSLEGFNKKACKKDGLSNHCRVCTKALGKKYLERNREKAAKKSRLWYQLNKERHHKNCREWIRKHPERRLAYERKSRSKNPGPHLKSSRKACKKAARTLSDNYIKKCLCANTGLNHSDIPPSLVEAGREILKFKRLRREQNEEHKRSKRQVG